ncbi:MAG: TIGR03067 domain-containing protein [Planctomycetes bacterium]|nr:TIGR03067 domain-containing protein [Planctomycetota bacterium]
MRTACGLLLLLASTVGADDKKDESKKLEGTWEVVALVAAGKEIPKEGSPKKLTIKEGKFTGFGPEMRLTTDATKTPKWLGMTFARDGKDFTVNAIYELSGDELKICLPMAPSKDSGKTFENKRPEGFDTKDKAEMFIHLRRAK